MTSPRETQQPKSLPARDFASLGAAALLAVPDADYAKAVRLEVVDDAVPADEMAVFVWDSAEVEALGNEISISVSKYVSTSVRDLSNRDTDIAMVLP